MVAPASLFQVLPASILFRKKRGFAVNVVDDWFNARAGNVFSEMLLDKDSLMYEQLKPEPCVLCWTNIVAPPGQSQAPV